MFSLLIILCRGIQASWLSWILFVHNSEAWAMGTRSWCMCPVHTLLRLYYHVFNGLCLELSSIIWCYGLNLNTYAFAEEIGYRYVKHCFRGRDRYPWCYDILCTSDSEKLLSLDLILTNMVIRMWNIFEFECLPASAVCQQGFLPTWKTGNYHGN